MDAAHDAKTETLARLSENRALRCPIERTVLVNFIRQPLGSQILADRRVFDAILESQNHSFTFPCAAGISATACSTI